MYAATKHIIAQGIFNSDGLQKTIFKSSLL